MGVEIEYQKAVYSLLYTNRVALGITGVYDVAPQNADGGDTSAFPYVVIGRMFPVQSDTQSKNGFEITSRIHVYSRTGSMFECKTIQGGIYDLLHLASLTVTGFNSYVLQRQDTDCFQESDGKIHGVCEYRGLVESTT